TGCKRRLTLRTGSSMKVLAIAGAVFTSFLWAPIAASQQPAEPAAAPATQAAPQAAPATPQATPATQAAGVGANYFIGPGDTIQVFVWRNPELTQTVPVRPDGKISTPLVEDMVAVGKTPTQLARDVETVLAEFIRSPQVNVIVTIPVSAFSQIKVIGQV